MTHVTGLLLSLSILASPFGSAQPPNLSGRWVLDSMMGGSPIAAPHPRSVCSGGAPPAARAVEPQSEVPDGGAVQVTGTGETFTAELVVTQTPDGVAIIRSYGGSSGKGTFTGRYTFGGNDDVNVVGSMTSRTRSRWDGPRFVIEGTVVVRRNGADVTCAVTETFEVAADGFLYVVETGSVNGRARSSRQTYVKAPVDRAASTAR